MSSGLMNARRYPRLAASTASFEPLSVIATNESPACAPPSCFTACVQKVSWKQRGSVVVPDFDETRYTDAEGSCEASKALTASGWVESRTVTSTASRPLGRVWRITSAARDEPPIPRRSAFFRPDDRTEEANLCSEATCVRIRVATSSHPYLFAISGSRVGIAPKILGSRFHMQVTIGPRREDNSVSDELMVCRIPGRCPSASAALPSLSSRE